MALGITKNLQSWRFQDHYVERVMDNAAYTSAHPDDTLVLAGPARLTSVNTSAEGTTPGSLLAIGMLQQVAFSQGKSTQPVMAIGSGRSFFVSGKAQGQGQIMRMFVNGRNLLRVLYHNARAANVPVSQMDDPAAVNNTSQFFINLDSELYYIPFGLASIFRTKSHQFVGGFYSELTMIQSYNISFNAGGNQIAENVSFLFDRLLPFASSEMTYNVTQATLDAVIGFVDPTSTDATGELTSDAYPEPAP